MSDEAVRVKTGKTWAEWYGILEKAGARAMDHKSIVALLAQQHDVEPWWRQVVAVGYEQSHGLRQKHQKPDGFQISRGKTFSHPVSVVFAAWEDEKTRACWLKQPGIVIPKATRDKSLRITWPDGRTNVEVNFYSKSGGKTQISVQHNKLSDAEAGERMKAYWGEKLDGLSALLAAARK